MNRRHDVKTGHALVTAAVTYIAIVSCARQCNCVYVTDRTFPTMHLLQEAQWPLAVVRTPIFSKSELSPPSRSSIASVFLLVVEAFASEPAVLLLLSLSSPRPPSVFLFTDFFCVIGGGVVEDTGS